MTTIEPAPSDLETVRQTLLQRGAGIAADTAYVHAHGLVQYYRDHVRASRDAWRAGQAGAGLAIVAPALPAKADLTRTRCKGIARWISPAAHRPNSVSKPINSYRKE